MQVLLKGREHGVAAKAAAPAQRSCAVASRQGATPGLPLVQTRAAERQAGKAGGLGWAQVCPEGSPQPGNGRSGSRRRPGAPAAQRSRRWQASGTARRPPGHTPLPARATDRPAHPARAWAQQPGRPWPHPPAPAFPPAPAAPPAVQRQVRGGRRGAGGLAGSSASAAARRRRRRRRRSLLQTRRSIAGRPEQLCSKSGAAFRHRRQQPGTIKTNRRGVSVPPQPCR